MVSQSLALNQACFAPHLHRVPWDWVIQLDSWMEIVIRLGRIRKQISLKGIYKITPSCKCNSIIYSKDSSNNKLGWVWERLVYSGLIVK